MGVYEKLHFRVSEKHMTRRRRRHLCSVCCRRRRPSELTIPCLPLCIYVHRRREASE
jgi:hypothetical protein